MGGTLSCAGDKRAVYGEDKLPYGTPAIKPVELGPGVKNVTSASEVTGTYPINCSPMIPGTCILLFMLHFISKTMLIF